MIILSKRQIASTWGIALAISLTLLITPVTSLAQGEADTVGSLPGIEISTSVDFAEVFIGDLITYAVTIVYDSTYQLIPPPLGANLGAFDVKDYQPDIETQLEDGRLQSRTTFVLSTFTTGEYTIPALPVMFMMPDSSRRILLAEPVPVSVKSLLENAGDSLDIKELKAQYEFAYDYTPYYWWGGAGLLLLSLIIFIWLRRRRKTVDGEPEDLRSPWEIAFERLAYLKESYLSDTERVDVEQVKLFYLELTEISRAYLGRMFLTDVPEMTTEQFIENFAGKELPAELFAQIVDFYRHADQVKFARYQPAEKRPLSDYAFAHDMVEGIRADFERRNQMEVQANKNGRLVERAAEEEQV